VTAKQIMLFIHASVKDKTHIQMGESTQQCLILAQTTKNKNT
jgi:hypothetical protein